MRRSLLAALVLAGGAAFAVVPASVGLAPAAAAQASGSTYTAVTPVRVLDTRNGTKVPCPADCLYTWGDNHGWRGVGTTTSEISTPEPVSGLTGSPSSSRASRCTRCVPTARCGAGVTNFANALAHSSSVPVPRPVRIPVPATVVDLDVRRALDGDGRVWTWGYNGNGDLGIGHTLDVGSRVEQAHLPVVTKLLAGQAAVPAP